MSDQILNVWAQQLGLTATPLFGHKRRDIVGEHLALLDGVRSSFLLSGEIEDNIVNAPDWAWSANVRHHVALKKKQVVVSRNSGSTETFQRHSVEGKLEEFLKYLELDSDSQKIISSIDHLVTTFRKHRSTLQEGQKAPASNLDSFLYLLALTLESDPVASHRNGQNIVRQYSLDEFDPARLSEDYVRRFVEEVSLNSNSMRKLITPLTIRHAGGTLFQEAHAEVLSEPVQMTLFGLADAAQQRLDLSLGVYYTPSGLARTLTDIAIDSHLTRGTIRIHDPAAGSGIFLCEAIRALQRKNYKGKIVLSGRDISYPAVQMARFSIACAVLDWPDHNISWSMEVGSFFDAAPNPSSFDLILMNPPFLSWQALSAEQKREVKDALGGTFAGRPDLSTAFIQKALTQISPGGTLATLIPRGVLDSQNGFKWRNYVLSNNHVRLIGTFGAHGLFRHAMVSIAAAIFERKAEGVNSADKSSAVMVWADERQTSADNALRALRRRSAMGSNVEERSRNWSIYLVKPLELAMRRSWLPTPNALGSILEVIERRNLRKIKDLFRVRQGIKTGLNEAFLLTDSELEKLPIVEQRLFRRVANSEDIIGGQVRSSTNIFYVPDCFKSKKELLRKVPVFGQKILKYENILKRRPKSNPQRWWEPVWPRKDLAARTPRILTKMFGGSDMAAVDLEGEFLPVQAFAWMPHWSELNIDVELREAALWYYCRLLNSRIFFLLRREFAAATTAGGQLDVSPRYVDMIPIPIPSRDDLIRLTSEKRPYLGASFENDDLIATAYGTSIASWPLNEKTN